MPFCCMMFKVALDRNSKCLEEFTSLTRRLAMQTEEDQCEPLGYFDNTTGCSREDMDACTAPQAAYSSDTLQV